MITGIVVALPEELSTLTSKRIDKGRCVFIGDKILVTCSGAGPKNAQTAAELLISKGATQLISWGCAAGLCASLKPGDLILADRLIDADDTEIVINPEWRNFSINLLKQKIGKVPASIHSGLLAESKTLIASSSEKKQFHTITDAVALDMESAAIAKVSGLHKLRFLVIRAIADPVTLDLPSAISYSLNDQGEIKLNKLLTFLALHPMELPALIKLGLYFDKAKRSLKTAAGLLELITDFDGSPKKQP